MPTMPVQTVTTRAHNRCGTMAQYKKLSGLSLSETPRAGTATYIGEEYKIGWFAAGTAHNDYA